MIHVNCPGCPNFDPLSRRTRDIQEFIRTETGRTDLEFGEFSWLSYFRCIFLDLVEVSVIWLWFLRPNMRMVDRFQEGRAFVAGGRFSVVKSWLTTYNLFRVRCSTRAFAHGSPGDELLRSGCRKSNPAYFTWQRIRTCSAVKSRWKMALVLKGLSSPALLTSYNAERLPIIAQMLHATNALYTHTVAKKVTTWSSKRRPRLRKQPGGCDGGTMRSIYLASTTGIAISSSRNVIRTPGPNRCTSKGVHWLRRF